MLKDLIKENTPVDTGTASGYDVAMASFEAATFELEAVSKEAGNLVSMDKILGAVAATENGDLAVQAILDVEGVGDISAEAIGAKVKKGATSAWDRVGAILMKLAGFFKGLIDKVMDMVSNYSGKFADLEKKIEKIDPTASVDFTMSVHPGSGDDPATVLTAGDKAMTAFAKTMGSFVKEASKGKITKADFDDIKAITGNAAANSSDTNEKSVKITPADVKSMKMSKVTKGLISSMKADARKVSQGLKDASIQFQKNSDSDDNDDIADVREAVSDASKDFSAGMRDTIKIIVSVMKDTLDGYKELSKKDKK